VAVGLDTGVLPRLAAAVPALRRRVEAAGLRPEDLADLEELARIPVLSKDDLIELQHANPPFGGLLAPGARPRRVFQSPGPLYEPEPDAEDPWRWAPALRAAGFAEGQLVVDAFGYHLTPAGAMFEEGLRAVGCTVLPGGVGSIDLQAAAIRDLGVTGFVGLPSYLKTLLERHDDLRLERAFLAAEPLLPPVRAWLRERVGVVRQGYGTAETGNCGFECEAEDGWHVPEDALVQVCALDDGRALGPGEEGQVVVTLFREDYAVVRLGTGDLSRLVAERCSCGRGTPRLAGWLGRVGEAVKVRGMFLHPRQVRSVMDGLDGVAAYRFVVERRADRDQLRVEVVPAGGSDGAAVCERVREAVRSGLRFNADVVAAHSIAEDRPVLEDVRSSVS
jgi:phenylacetate-CoA ligase